MDSVGDSCCPVLFHLVFIFLLILFVLFCSFRVKSVMLVFVSSSQRILHWRLEFVCLLDCI